MQLQHLVAVAGLDAVIKKKRKKKKEGGINLVHWLILLIWNLGWLQRFLRDDTKFSRTLKEKALFCSIKDTTFFLEVKLRSLNSVADN